MSDRQVLLRSIPSLDRLLEHDDVRPYRDILDPGLLTELLREAVDEIRQQVLQGKRSRISTKMILRAFQNRCDVLFTDHMRRVINGTGVILHTGLGRAPISTRAAERLVSDLAGYTSLEFDLPDGKRGHRNNHVEKLICRLTGAEAAVVVNNNAAAVYIALNALANRKEVIVSRGQLVEIGGRFRVPDVIRRSGCRMIDVGTTNKTHLEDYQDAVTERTRILLRVHTSNFKQLGFVHQPELSQLVELAHARDLILYDDLGSGAFFNLGDYGLTPEPLVTDSIENGVDLVSFSGDKLLGGAQAGILAGKAPLIQKIKKSPLMRVLRPDKFTLGILEATLEHYLGGEHGRQQIPVVRMLTEPREQVRERAEELLGLLQIPQDYAVCELVDSTARSGSGALPEEPVPSVALKVKPQKISVAQLARRLRLGRPAVVGYIQKDDFYLDLKAVAEDELKLLAEILNRLAAENN